MLLLRVRRRRGPAGAASTLRGADHLCRGRLSGEQSAGHLQKLTTRYQATEWARRRLRGTTDRGLLYGNEKYEMIPTWQMREGCICLATNEGAVPRGMFEGHGAGWLLESLPLKGHGEGREWDRERDGRGTGEGWGEGWVERQDRDGEKDGIRMGRRTQRRMGEGRG